MGGGGALGGAVGEEGGERRGWGEGGEGVRSGGGGVAVGE